MHNPAEIFGYTPEQEADEKKENLDNEYCRFIDGKCTKKSEKESIEKRSLQFGVCSAYHSGRHMGDAEPCIICPRRIEQNDVIFYDAARVLGNSDNFEIKKEIHISAIDSKFDYFVTNQNDVGEITDFCALEPMMLSTSDTGDLVDGFLDFLDYGEMDDRYGYGINWRQVIGRMESQLFMKGRIIEDMNEQMMWGIQDVFWDYIKHNHPVLEEPLNIERGFSEEKPVGLVIYTLDGSPEVGYNVRRKNEYWGDTEDWLDLLYPKGEVSRKDVKKKLQGARTYGST